MPHAVQSLRRAHPGAPAPDLMKPAPFRYAASESLEHALALKAEFGEEARFLAGGQSLIPAMNFRLAQPASVTLT